MLAMKKFVRGRSTVRMTREIVYTPVVDVFPADRAEISCVGESSVVQYQMPSKNPSDNPMT